MPCRATARAEGISRQAVNITVCRPVHRRRTGQYTDQHTASTQASAQTSTWNSTQPVHIWEAWMSHEMRIDCRSVLSR